MSLMVPNRIRNSLGFYFTHAMVALIDESSQQLKAYRRFRYLSDDFFVKISKTHNGASTRGAVTHEGG
ncbi:hypothetical protein MPL3365_170056 [Mesorhizobium plurifarium]|uniref:Uncharacterized protein n=1 Tax=Mesorhizobium plurifarium TaxID=69974 RepID=A0A090GTC2_MESPL|nr:hypothetical protein MPL3365_170056 [Mesorhizobium plurifarium]